MSRKLVTRKTIISIIAVKSNIAKFTFELYILNERILLIIIIASSFEY